MRLNKSELMFVIGSLLCYYVSMRKKSKNISERQKEILRFIIEKVKELGYPPTVREICQAISLKSSATIHVHLKKLEELGYIKRNPLKPRAIEINHQAVLNMNSNFSDEGFFPGVDNKSLIHSDSNSGDYQYNDFSEEPERNMVMIPVVGQIAAGSPILAAENIEDYFPLTADFVKNNNQVFILKVKGDSMINAGILDRDFAVIRKQETAMNGEIIAALLEDEATIKRFFKKEKSIKLMPENDLMKPIEVKNARVLGKVIGIIRKYF